MSTLRACGRHYATEEAASRAKKVIAGTHLPIHCLLYEGWHLGKIQAAPGRHRRPPGGEDVLPDTLSAYARARIEIQPNGCWHWTGPLRSDGEGYGVANLPGGKRDAAHRLVYQQTVGSIPAGMSLDHQCHNQDEACPGGKVCLHRRCVNPAHLEVATLRDNTRRGKTPPAINLRKKTCPEGHPYDRVNSKGWRSCSICDLARLEAKRRAQGIPERKLWQSHCSHGHEYTPENTRWSKGNRYCKACDAERSPLDAEKRRQPCRGCGGPKEPGKAYSYCAKCRRKRKGTGPSLKVRLRVLSRDKFQCARCGKPCGPGIAPYSLQHRKARGTGGDSQPENLVLLCGTATSPDCHRLCEDRDEDCHVRGYWIASWEDPAMVPVMYFEESGCGFTAWLCEDGGLSFEPPGEVA